MTLHHAQLRRAAEAIRAGAVEPVTAEPMPGFYKTALVRGGPLCPVRIWFGPPLDPDFPRFLDRAPTWNALANGSRYDVDRLWPYAAKHPIGQAEYRYLLAVFRYARRYDPTMPQASPMQRINLSNVRPLF